MKLASHLICLPIHPIILQFIVDLNRRRITSTDIVADKAFSAGGNIGDSNTQGSGYGDYA
jgi:hypothetical protein